MRSRGFQALESSIRFTVPADFRSVCPGDSTVPADFRSVCPGDSVWPRAIVWEPWLREPAWLQESWNILVSRELKPSPKGGLRLFLLDQTLIGIPGSSRPHDQSGKKALREISVASLLQTRASGLGHLWLCLAGPCRDGRGAHPLQWEAALVHLAPAIWSYERTFQRKKRNLLWGSKNL